MQPLHEAPEPGRVELHPQYDVLATDDPSQHLMSLRDAAEHWEIGMDRLHPRVERFRIAGEAVADSVDLIVVGVEVAPLVPRIVKLERLHLLDCVRV